jgi:hypothetical protein
MEKELRQRYKEKRPKRLGCMQVERTRHEEPSYKRLLVKYGIISATTQDAWGKWTQVCTDPAIVTLSLQLEKAKKVSFPSVAAPFQNLAHVLAAMNEKQLADLRSRVS